MNAPSSIYQLGNPFASRAADRLGGFPSTVGIGVEEEPSQAHVETETMAKLREEVRNYLARPTRGRALAVVGPYGIGKTHLTREIISLIRHQEVPPPLWMMDGAIIELDDLYQDRLMILRDDRNQQAAFEDLVSDYLADVTAAELEREDDPRERRTEIIQGLREREYDAEKVARALRLDPERIHRSLRRHLREITEHRKFATALALLLESDFNLAVWDWLSGREPQQALIDRGIDEPIKGINRVFETLAVFAFIYGTGRKPYVMVLDALENVFDWADLDRNKFIDAFLRLINVYISRGGLLIFCIPPEPLGRLPTSLHERTLQFWPTGLTDEQAAELVREHMAAHQAAARAAVPAIPMPPDDLAPFTGEAVAEIRALFNGNPRWMLTTCSQAWETAEDLSNPTQMIDVSIVHQAVRTLLERAPRDHVLSAIGETLTNGQWRTETGVTRFADRAAGRADRVDFWLHVARSSVLAIMVCDSILVGAQVDDLEQDIKAARDEARGPAEVLLVVNGLLSPRLRRRLVGIARTQPVVYDDQRFPDRLHAALTELAHRLETAEQANSAAALQARVGRLDGQQAEVLDHLRQLDDRLGRLDRLPGLAAPDGAAISARPELPGPVQDLFVRAYRALDLLSDISTGLDRGLGLDRPAAEPAGDQPRRLGFTPDQFQAIGVATMMRRLLEAFERSVDGWLRTVPRGGTGVELTDEHLRRLFVMCRSFEITTEVMPLSDLASMAGSSTAGSPLSATERHDRVLGRAEAEDVFNGLAAAVRSAAIEAAEPVGDLARPGQELR